MFSFRAWAEKGIARHIDAWRERRGWDLVIFDWFVLGMRMQVILDSSFVRPGSAPIWGGKKGEFRDWTILKLASSVRALLKPYEDTVKRLMIVDDSWALPFDHQLSCTIIDYLTRS